MIQDNKINKYDKAIIILLISIAFGGLYIGFGALQYSRILAILFAPMLLSKITKCNYIKPLLFFALFVILYGGISLLWSPNPSRGIEELLYYIVHFLLFFEIIVFSKYATKAFQSISLGWILSLSITLVIAMWEITTGEHLSNSVDHGDTFNLGYGQTILRRYAAVAFHNYNSYVTYICMALPFVFFSLFGKLKKKNFIYLIVIILLSASVILFNSSRGGLLCLIVFFLIYFINSPKKKYVIPIFVMLGGGMLFYFGEDMLSVISYRLSDGGLTTDTGRMQIYSNAIKVFFDTFGFGTGVGGLNSWMSKFSNDILATHNLFLEILAQFGFVIFLLFTVFMVRLFFKSLKVSDSNRRIVLYMLFFSLPILSIIDSGYLLGAHFFAYISSIIVFVNHEQIRPINKNL